MCESETVPILHFLFFLVHSHLLLALSILLLLISCKNMYIRLTQWLPEVILTPWFIFQRFAYLISTKQYYSMMEIFEWAPDKQKSQR